MSRQASTTAAPSLMLALDPTELAWLERNPQVRELLLAAGKSAAVSSATIEVDADLLAALLGRPVSLSEVDTAHAIVECFADQIAAAARGLHSIAISIDRLRRLSSTDVRLVTRGEATAQLAASAA